MIDAVEWILRTNIDQITPVYQRIAVRARLDFGMVQLGILDNGIIALELGALSAHSLFLEERRRHL